MSLATSLGVSVYRLAHSWLVIVGVFVLVSRADPLARDHRTARLRRSGFCPH